MLSCSSLDPINVRENNIDEWTQTETQILTLINNERFSELTPDITLYYETINRSKEMKSLGEITHNGIGKYILFLKQKGFNQITELLGFGYTSPESFFNSMMSSDSHKESMLDNRFKYIGISVLMADEGNYYSIFLAN